MLCLCTMIFLQILVVHRRVQLLITSTFLLHFPPNFSMLQLRLWATQVMTFIFHLNASIIVKILIETMKVKFISWESLNMSKYTSRWRWTTHATLEVTITCQTTFLQILCINRVQMLITPTFWHPPSHQYVVSETMDYSDHDLA